MIKRILTTAVLCAALVAPLPVSAAENTFSEAQKLEIQNIIKDYLVKNPQVTEDALKALQTKLHNDEVAMQNEAISSNKSELEATTLTPAAGNLQGDVTVVEFFDYRCGYCKSVTPTVESLIAADKNVKVVYREFPILGPVSVFAAKAALAAAQQGKYLEMHNALMKSQRPISSENEVMAIAGGLGLDTAKLRQDMEGKVVRDELANNFKLAENMGIRGTPAFVIGKKMYPSAMDIDSFRGAVSQARLEAKAPGEAAKP